MKSLLVKCYTKTLLYILLLMFQRKDKEKQKIILLMQPSPPLPPVYTCTIRCIIREWCQKKRGEYLKIQTSNISKAKNGFLGWLYFECKINFLKNRTQDKSTGSFKHVFSPYLGKLLLSLLIWCLKSKCEVKDPVFLVPLKQIVWFEREKACFICKLQAAYRYLKIKPHSVWRTKLAQQPTCISFSWFQENRVPPKSEYLK